MLIPTRLSMGRSWRQAQQARSRKSRLRRRHGAVATGEPGCCAEGERREPVAGGENSAIMISSAQIRAEDCSGGTLFAVTAIPLPHTCRQDVHAAATHLRTIKAASNRESVILQSSRLEGAVC